MRYKIIILLLFLIILSGCRVFDRELVVPQHVIDNLPKEKALEFLNSLEGDKSFYYLDQPYKEGTFTVRSSKNKRDFKERKYSSFYYKAYYHSSYGALYFDLRDKKDNSYWSCWGCRWYTYEKDSEGYSTLFDKILLSLEVLGVEGR